jgi:predicted acyltransferase (DUF342 family)
MSKNKTLGQIVLLLALGCLASHAWAGPIGITKPEASPIGVDSLALYSGKSMSFGRDVSIAGPVAAARSISLGGGDSTGNLYSGGSVYLGNSSNVKGDIWGNGNISINSKSVVAGDITTQGKYWKNKSAKVTGEVILGKDARLLVLPSMDVAPDKGSLGSTKIWKGRNTTTNLDAGNYNTVGFDRSATLNLSAGTYTMKSFSMGRDGAVNIDTSMGDVILNVHSGFSVGRDVTFNTQGNGELFLNVFGKNVWLDNNTKMDATVRVYGGKFSTGNDVELTGSFHASNNIYLGQGSQVSYAPAGSSAVPEPATVALLAIGGMICAFRRHRRKSGR